MELHKDVAYCPVQILKTGVGEKDKNTEKRKKIEIEGECFVFFWNSPSLPKEKNVLPPTPTKKSVDSNSDPNITIWCANRHNFFFQKLERHLSETLIKPICKMTAHIPKFAAPS